MAKYGRAPSTASRTSSRPGARTPTTARSGAGRRGDHIEHVNLYSPYYSDAKQAWVVEAWCDTYEGPRHECKLLCGSQDAAVEMHQRLGTCRTIKEVRALFAEALQSAVEAKDGLRYRLMLGDPPTYVTATRAASRT